MTVATLCVSRSTDVIELIAAQLRVRGPLEEASLCCGMVGRLRTAAARSKKAWAAPTRA